MSIILATDKLNFEDIIHYPDIQIKSDKVTFISGNSGCGKTTLLRLFNGTLSPKFGKILYENNDISSLDTVSLRREVLLAAQSVYLFDETIKENFDTYYKYRDLPGLNNEKIKKYLSICSIDFPISSNCSSMSGGERQRIFIAICISFMPKILMLDEPTSALDVSNSASMLTNLKSFCAENHITLVVVSHDKDLAVKFADDIIYLK